MSVSTEQYLGLSALAYRDLSSINFGGQGSEISALIANSTNAEYSALSSLGNWQLISFKPTTSTGFAAAAFRNPTTGEIVFSFRGTDQWFNDSGLGEDVNYANLGIALQNAVDGLPLQFGDAEAFVYSILNDSAYAGAAYSFTGHSLGGSLASYMTYKTNTDNIAGVGKAVTFNAPGISGLLPSGVNNSSYNTLVTDHVGEGDFVGQFRADEQLGTTVYHKSSTAMKNEDNVLEVLNDILVMNNPFMNVFDRIKAAKDGTGNPFAAFNGIKTPDDYHQLRDMITNGQMNASTGGSQVSNLANGVDNAADIVGYVGQGVITASNGMRFATVTISNTLGGIIYFGAEGVGKFLNTSGKLITGLSYYGAEGVEKFIDTSEFIFGGVGYYAIEGIGDFFQTATDGIEGVGQGIWNLADMARNAFADGFGFVSGLFTKAAGIPPTPRDPLILDLNGDGVKTTDLTGSTTHFDLDANGFAERVGWVSASDGLLVLDRNGNGKIDDGTELFGDRTLLQDGTLATSGFEALAEFDSNQDGIIDENETSKNKHLKIEPGMSVVVEVTTGKRRIIEFFLDPLMTYVDPSLEVR